MAYSLGVKEKAIKLRKRGYSLNEVSARFGISKSTASYWLENIDLSDNALKRLKDREIIGQYKTVLIKKKKRRDFFEFLKAEKLDELKTVRLNKLFFRVLASVFFWCEGSKGDLTKLGFTNSDPKMIECFLCFLRKGFEIDETKFRAVVHLHSYHNEEKQIRFWSEVTKIPVRQFSKSFQKKNSGKRIRKDYQGCLSIRYYDAKLAKELWTYYQTLQTFIGV